jgi:hypothetical protein
MNANASIPNLGPRLPSAIRVFALAHSRRKVGSANARFATEFAAREIYRREFQAGTPVDDFGG